LQFLNEMPDEKWKQIQKIQVTPEEIKQLRANLYFEATNYEKYTKLQKRNHQRALELLKNDNFIADILRIKKKWKIPLKGLNIKNKIPPKCYSLTSFKEIRAASIKAHESAPPEGNYTVWPVYTAIYKKDFLEDLALFIILYRLAPNWFEDLETLFVHNELHIPMDGWYGTFSDPAGIYRYMIEVTPDMSFNDLKKSYQAIFTDHFCDNQKEKMTKYDDGTVGISMDYVLRGRYRPDTEKDLKYWHLKRQQNYSWKKVVVAYQKDNPSDHRSDITIKEVLRKSIARIDKRQKKFFGVENKNTS
jgi:hypothetical protein